MKLGVATESLSWLLTKSATRARASEHTPTEAEGETIAETMKNSMVPLCLSALKKIAALRHPSDALIGGGLAKMCTSNFIPPPSHTHKQADDDTTLLLAIQRNADAAVLYSQTWVDIAPTPGLEEKLRELKATINDEFLRLANLFCFVFQ